MDAPAMDAPQVETPAIEIESFRRLLTERLPGVAALGIEVEAVELGLCRLRMPVDERHLRPGDVVSGPTLFALADFALYGAVLSHSNDPEGAVTTAMQIHFLRRTPPAPVIATAKLLQAGRTLLTGTVKIESAENGKQVAFVTGSYVRGNPKG